MILFFGQRGATHSTGRFPLAGTGGNHGPWLLTSLPSRTLARLFLLAVLLKEDRDNNAFFVVYSASEDSFLLLIPILSAPVRHSFRGCEGRAGTQQVGDHLLVTGCNEGVRFS